MCLDRAVNPGEAFPRIRGKVVWKAVQRLGGVYRVCGPSGLSDRELKLGVIQVPDVPEGTIPLLCSAATYPAGIHVLARKEDALAYGKWNWGPSRPDIRILRGVLLGKVLFRGIQEGIRGIQEGIPVVIVDKVVWVEDVGAVFAAEEKTK